MRQESSDSCRTAEDALLQFLKDVVLPEAKKSLMKTKDLRTWCAAASTGEEPYTLAMILKDFFSLMQILRLLQWDQNLSDYS